jgi:hypothetical protein
VRTSVAIAGISLVLAVPVAMAGNPAAEASSIVGRWDAALLNNGPAVPFRLDISAAGPDLRGTFYDGFKPYDATTTSTFKDGQLVLKASTTSPPSPRP